MRIQDFQRVYEAVNDDEVTSALRQSYGDDVNSFWLSHGTAKYPAIFILVNKGLACLHYFPKKGHPGFRSVGAVQGLPLNGTTTFFTSIIREQKIINNSVVPFSTVILAAKEFLVSDILPKSVTWFEL